MRILLCQIPSVAKLMLFI